MLTIDDHNLDTIGDLRGYLTETRARWRPDPALPDSAAIPRRATGGKVIPPTAPTFSVGDFLNSLTRQPTNSFLLARRVALGVADRETGSDCVQPRIVPEHRDVGPLPSPLPVPPAQVDWRNRFGWPWITSVQNQGNCQLCWCFSACALLESMVRIEHCVWFKGSETDLELGCNAVCGSSGGDNTAIDYAIANGLCDEQCMPYASGAAEQPCADFDGRSVRYSTVVYQTIPSNSTAASPTTNVNYQMEKVWLDLNGPFGFFMYGAPLGSWGSSASTNFADWQTSDESDLDHFVLCVGYDDDLGAWICKNSYGPAWNGDGFFYMAYGACGSEILGHSALYGTNPDPWSKRRLHSGSLVEGEDGINHMNFDSILVPGDGSLRHYQRDNDALPLPWNSAESVPSDDAVGVGWPAIMETTFDRNLELVYATTGQRLHHWSYPRPAGPWQDGGVFGPLNVIGAPGFVQSTFGQNGAPGNFEVVVVDADQQLEHWSRDNAAAANPWTLTATFGNDVAISGPGLVQSHYGNQGNFEFVCVLTNGQMEHWFRANDAPGAPWSPTTTFGSDIASSPCMIEGNSGAESEYAVGNFELCVASGGNLQHWYRENNGDGQWHGPTTFGDGHETSVVGLIQSSFGFNLELLAARDDGHIQHYWRDSASLEWHEGEFVV